VVSNLSNPKIVPFEIKDVAQEGSIKGEIKIGAHGIYIKLDGHGEKNMPPGYGEPVMIEFYDDQARVIIWSDINDEEPTHHVRLDGAKEEKRLPDETVQEGLESR